MVKKEDTEVDCLEKQKTEPYYYWAARCEQNDALKKRTGTKIECYEKGRFIDDPRPQLFTEKKSCLSEKNLVMEVQGKKKGKMVPACRWVQGCFVNT